MASGPCEGNMLGKSKDKTRPGQRSLLREVTNWKVKLNRGQEEIVS
jgi:hypothetical protein